MTGKYDDIINVRWPIPSSRPRMAMTERASQFSPFAALNGYEDAIKEAERTTEEKIEQDDEALKILDGKLHRLKENLDNAPQVSVRYFKADESKSGGAYLAVCGTVKRVDEGAKRLVMTDGTKIPLADILDIEGEFFRRD